MRGAQPPTPEQIEHDLAEFEFLLSFRMTVERACDRIGLHPQTILRRYRAAGQTPPPGLETIASGYRKKAAV